MNTLFIDLLIAHVLADFFFQPARWCEKKEKGNIKYLLYHTAVVFGCSAILLLPVLAIFFGHSPIFVVKSWIYSLSIAFVVKLWIYSLLIALLIALIVAILHFGIDFLKEKSRKGSNNIRWFVGDQLAHIAAIWLVLQLFEIRVNPSHDLLLILAFLLCLKPANVFIQKFFASTPPAKEQADATLPRAGRIIGSLERVLTLTLILAGQWGAVGFLFAAKSILRFRDTEHASTEYLLIGSLWSFGIAIILGLLCIKL